MLTSLLLVAAVLATSHASDCRPEYNHCEFWLYIKKAMTMVHQGKMLKAVDGRIYRNDEHPSNFTTHIPLDEVITTDGKMRIVTTVNETIPGPNIIVYENQMLTIHVLNELETEATSLHWHGLHQRGTPWMDGIGYITQCPIMPGQSFTYHFKASPKGTFWYHSHIAEQRTEGVQGAFIIREKPKPNVPKIEEHIMIVGDWEHKTSLTNLEILTGGPDVVVDPTNGVPPGDALPLPKASVLINGRGRLTDPDTGIKNMTPLTWLNVTQGQVYRFRVIGTAALKALRISIDNHMLTLTASDGYDLEEKVVESIVVHSGERFDFFITANKKVGNYWIRAESLEVGQPSIKGKKTEAVLHYQGACDETEPTTQRQKCTTKNPCDIVNCQFGTFHPHNQMNCITFNDLKAKNPEPTPKYVRGDSSEHFLNFAFPGNIAVRGSINGKVFKLPPVPVLTQPKEIGNIGCRNKNCSKNSICKCHHTLSVGFNKTMQMVWTSVGQGRDVGHPIHMHGHSFYVLKMGFPDINKKTGKIGKSTRDIRCYGNKKLNYCNSAGWKRKSWKHGNIPGLNLKNPPRKDTLIIPAGGYAVVRIRTDNPGRWFMHCHIDFHAMTGMRMVINEAVKRQPRPPYGFPVCQEFHNDRRRDVQYIRKR